MNFWTILLDIILLLLSCTIAGGVASRVKLSPMLGYLVAGVLLGTFKEYLHIESSAQLYELSELGVALLMFSIGLEFSWKRIRSLGVKLLAAGSAQILLTIILISVASLLLTESHLKSQIALGIIICVSSTAAVLRTLSERLELETVFGRDATAILLTQDMAVIPLAVILGALNSEGGSQEILSQSAYLLLGAAIIILGFKLLLDKIAVPIIQLITSEGNRELVTLIAITIGFGGTYIAHSVGLSPSLGAFVSGMFLGGTPFASLIRADISSLKVLFLTLFFGTVGMLADISWIGENILLVLLASVSCIALKTVASTIGLRLVGLSFYRALPTSLVIAQLGEFSLVLAGIAFSTQLIDAHTQQLIISTSLLSLCVTPFLITLASRLATKPELSKALSSSNVSSDSSYKKACVIGFGPAGRKIAKVLDQLEYQVTVIDLNASVLRIDKSYVYEKVVGDSRNAEVLEHAKIHEAEIIALTLPSLEATQSTLSLCRKLTPHSRIFVRSRYEAFRSALEHLTPCEVVSDENSVGEIMGKSIRALHEAREAHTES